ncbi:glycerol-3-phosphate 1-O-acyltransferase PlsY [Pasteuria penetrans]|uniref:glycerol-3-phosphate 1-O-acyltransferase PlsY n=1 Tax=Pasteuria penetrans TaxID=86005 RepID=UPI000F983324|nr:glycerol-3-phosphate 1-O-acyltransferase PlsY [Pasteuria penetrans]
MSIIIFCCFIAYLLGTFNPAYGLTRVCKGYDIREMGSGNAGATNASRMLGKSLGFVVLFLDMGKGMIAALLPSWWGYGHQPLLSVLVGSCAVLGHMFPIFLSFRGGKGIATILGVAFVTDPLIGLWMSAIGLGIIIITRYVSLGCLVMLLFFPFLLWVRNYHSWVIIFASFIVFLSWLRHRRNIANLLHGKERRFLWKS